MKQLLHNKNGVFTHSSRKVLSDILYEEIVIVYVMTNMQDQVHIHIKIHKVRLCECVLEREREREREREKGTLLRLICLRLRHHGGNY